MPVPRLPELAQIPAVVISLYDQIQAEQRRSVELAHEIGKHLVNARHTVCKKEFTGWLTRHPQLHFARFPHGRTLKTPGNTRGVPNNARFGGTCEPLGTTETSKNPRKSALSRRGNRAKCSYPTTGEQSQQVVNPMYMLGVTQLVVWVVCARRSGSAVGS